MQAATDAPIACKLGDTALQVRLAWIRAVTARSLLHHRVDGSTLQLAYRRDALHDVEQIVAQERECCPFLTFTLRTETDEVLLAINAPDGTGPEVRSLLDQFLPLAPTDAPRKACGCRPGACG